MKAAAGIPTSWGAGSSLQRGACPVHGTSLLLGKGRFSFSGPIVSTLRIFKGGSAIPHLEGSSSLLALWDDVNDLFGTGLKGACHCEADLALPVRFRPSLTSRLSAVSLPLTPLASETTRLPSPREKNVLAVCPLPCGCYTVTAMSLLLDNMVLFSENFLVLKYFCHPTKKKKKEK
jgi:hypothetical protein